VHVPVERHWQRKTNQIRLLAGVDRHEEPSAISPTRGALFFWKSEIDHFVMAITAAEAIVRHSASHACYRMMR
jgi:hypothetical protein